MNIYAKPAHYYKHGTLTTRNPHLYRTSSLVRGNQIAAYLGWELNPEERELGIYVKPNENEISEMPDGSFIDVIDAFHLFHAISKRPKLNVILTSQYHYELWKNRIPNKIIVIPHHHCNFDREIRTKTEVDTVGYIGSIRGIDLDIDEATKRFNDMGLKFLTNYDFRGREDSVAFYKQIDIQLVWKPDNLPGHTPMKITNAASYGIPSISKPCEHFKEIEGFYITAPDKEGLYAEVEKLKDPDYYASWSERLIPEMEKYHISNIAKQYEELEHLA